jgi:GNAT superfamily N-acetyltransferase
MVPHESCLMSNAILKDTSLSLTDFRGDFDRLAQLMQRSWSDNPAPGLLYSTEFLESLFRQPGASYALAPTIYYGTTPVGFVAGFPRHIKYKNREWNVLIITLLTVSSEYKKLGFGVALWCEVVKRARNLGFDGMMNYCIDREPMNGMIVGCCQRLQLPVEQVYSINYLTSILWPKATELSTEADHESTDAFLAEAMHVCGSAEIGRRWTPEEAQWQCSREGAVVARYEAGSRRGLLTGYVMGITDQNHTQSLLVEDIFWGSLNAEERTALVRRLAVMAVARGARIAIAPVLGYADMEPFRAARFRPSTRKLHAYFTLWKESPTVEKVRSFSLDVF